MKGEIVERQILDLIQNANQLRITSRHSITELRAARIQVIEQALNVAL